MQSYFALLSFATISSLQAIRFLTPLSTFISYFIFHSRQIDYFYVFSSSFTVYGLQFILILSFAYFCSATDLSISNLFYYYSFLLLYPSYLFTAILFSRYSNHFYYSFHSTLISQFLTLNFLLNSFLFFNFAIIDYLKCTQYKLNQLFYFH